MQKCRNILKFKSLNLSKIIQQLFKIQQDLKPEMVMFDAKKKKGPTL